MSETGTRDVMSYLESELQKTRDTLKDCNNELCYKCKEYMDHPNMCIDCRWNLNAER